MQDVIQAVKECRPRLSAQNAERDMEQLKKAEGTDYFYLVLEDGAYLFTAQEVYTVGSFAFQLWLRPLRQGYNVAALWLRVERAPKTHPAGPVLTVDYTTLARDVELFAAVDPKNKQKHIRRIFRVLAEDARAGSVEGLSDYLMEHGGQGE